MELCNAANLAVRIARISLDDHLSHSGVLTALHDEAEFDPLMLRINRRIHADCRGEVSVFSQDPLHALDTRSYLILIEILPDLQLAAIRQLIGGRWSRRTVHDKAADKQLLFDYEIQVERTILIGIYFGCYGSEPARGEQLL